jgi:hypothetical protein
MLGAMEIALIVAAFLAFAVIAFLVQRKAGAAKTRIDDGLAALDVQRQDKAHLIGLQSGEERQSKAIGALALSPDELVFLQLVPEREVRIPRAAVSSAEVGREFLGRTHPRDLLIVTWGEGDDADVAGFEVSDAAGWTTELGT